MILKFGCIVFIVKIQREGIKIYIYFINGKVKVINIFLYKKLLNILEILKILNLFDKWLKILDYYHN